MGVGYGLAGDSVVPLSVWLAERRRQLEDVVISECVPAFPADVVAAAFKKIHTKHGVWLLGRRQWAGQQAGSGAGRLPSSAQHIN